MCTRPFTKTFPPSVHERLLGIQSVRTLTLPCGKCADCLRKRQNDLATRVYIEAKKRGSAVFVTLTYKPEYVPLAQSHWISDVQTGEMERVTFPELVMNPYNLEVWRGDIAKMMCGKKDLVPEVDFSLDAFDEFDPKHHHFVRVTPTLYYEDVKLCMKRFRKVCDKDFSYICVGEYGSSKYGFHRPHYHLIFFGLRYLDVKLFCDNWVDVNLPKFDENNFYVDRSLGYYKIKPVIFKRKINGREQDGLAAVSRYVGKYCSKGQFDIYTKRDGCVLSNRLRSSKGLGVDVTQKFQGITMREWYLALDQFKYDPENPEVTAGDKLPQIIDKIIERSFYTINGFKFALPCGLRRKLYGYRVCKEGFEVPEPFKFMAQDGKIFEKAIYSPLYYLVASELRGRAQKKDTAEFEQFISHFPAENLSSAVVAYNHIQEVAAQTREASASSNILKFYSKKSKL